MPDDVACVFCTSGTTARPKVVVYDHAAYWLNGLDTLEFLGLTENDRTLEYRSFGWNSAQVLSLLPFLQKGLTLHIAKRFSHSRFFEWVQKYGITFSAGVPTVLNMLLNKPLGYTAKDIPTLRLMSCSTAPLTAQQWVQFEEMYGVTLLQLYGMSETGWVCGNRYYTRKMGTVGPPALHQELQILDPAGKECPVDVEGEITVGGPQMAIGYLLDDGSVDPVRGKRIKTGDLGIKDAEDFIRVTGRSKDLIIRGGVNIAPLEIDEILLKHPGILDAAAVGVPDKIYGEEVVCYVVPKETGLTEASVRRHCQEHLPPAKTPKQIFIVPDLPKSDRGKVLRDKLREDWAARAKLWGRGERGARQRGAETRKVESTKRCPGRRRIKAIGADAGGGASTSLGRGAGRGMACALRAIVPLSAGSAVESFRASSSKLSKQLGQPIVVDWWRGEQRICSGREGDGYPR